MIAIGLTGGIASGKSTVARLLAQHGATVVDADALVHDLYAAGAEGTRAVASAFGPAVLAPDGSVDRTALGRIVFADAEKRDQLGAIIWPLVRGRVESLKRSAQAGGATVIVVEAPLLIEAGWTDLVDQVWLVRTPRSTALDRLLARGGLTPGEAEARIAAQPSGEARTPYAHVLIDNDGDLAALAAKVDALWHGLS